MSYDMMTDEEYKEMNEAEVEPCPFCGKELIFTDDHHGALYEHPSGDCWASHAVLIDLKDIKRWNQRVGEEETFVVKHSTRDSEIGDIVFKGNFTECVEFLIDCSDGEVEEGETSYFTEDQGWEIK